jgi:two-component system response regulator FlrC
VKLLIEHFMRQFLGEDAPPLAPDVLAALLNYPWPGNIRELQNAVERAAILSRGAPPQESDFLLGLGATGQRSTLRGSIEKEVIPTPVLTENSQGVMIRSGTTVQEMEKALILETLKSTGENRTQAAKLLGISIRTLRNKLHEYNMGGAEDELSE